MDLKRKKRLLNLLLAVVCIAVIACVFSGSKVLCVVGLGLCIVYGTIHSTIWRCPHCRGSLGRGKPVTCPECGEKLEY